MNIQLSRPLIVFDLETTGINITKDRIVEIAMIKLMPNGEKIEYCKRVNPLMPIPKESSEIHGIWDKDVQDCPTLKEIGDEIIEFIGDGDLAGFNSNRFDIPVLIEELMRNDLFLDVSNREFIDVQNIFHKMEQRTLVAAYKFYCEKDLANAHSALYDTQATLEVLESQINKYKDLENSVSFLSKFSNASNQKMVDLAGRLVKNDRNEVIYNFGKHRGKTIQEVMKIEPGYYGWMLDADFPLYTKNCLRIAMEEIKAKAKSEDHLDLESKLNLLQNKFKKS